MYGLWILVMIFGIVGLAFIIPAILAEPMYNKYRDQLKYKFEVDNGFGGKYISESRFDNTEWDRNRLSEEEANRLEKAYHKYKFWDSIHCTDPGEFLGIAGTVLLVTAVIIALPAIFVPISSAQEVAYWQEFKPMAEDIISNSTSAQALGITDEVIEYNTWLAKARSSQEIWKNWSCYYNIDLSTLDYISIGGN